jgi:hypothetical protein
VLFNIEMYSQSVMAGSPFGSAAPAAGGVVGRGARGANKRLESSVGPGARFRISHESRGADEAQADSLAIVGELLAVEVAAEVALLHRDPGCPREGVVPVAQRLHDEVPHGAGSVIQLE